MDSAQLARGLVWYLVFVFSTTCHEAAHAIAAHLGGDSTAKDGGQATLDPIPHIRREPVGMVLMPLLSFYQLGFMLGWASAPYDALWGQRYPRRQAVMSLAGPLANFGLALGCFLAMKLLVWQGVFIAPAHASFSQLVEVPGAEGARTPLTFLAMALSIGCWLNLVLGIFNLIPLPPLDGAGVVEGLAHRQVGKLFQALRQQPLLAIVGLLLAMRLFRYVAPKLGTVLGLLHPGTTYW